MEAKEKAIELVNKFLPYSESSIYPKSTKIETFKNEPVFENAKQNALIAVDELINDNMPYSTDYAMNCGFWQKVKIEIEKY